MKLGLPWNVRDARPDARETAQEAARRAGLPVNEWVNTAILQRVAEQGIRSFPARPRNDGPAEEYSRLLSRLDDLTRRFEQSARPSAYPQKGRPPTDTFTDAIDRLEFRLREISDRLPGSSSPASAPLSPSLERAVAEFTSRRRALSNDHFYDQNDGAGAGLESKTEHTISGLDAQLRRITEELEAFKRPAIEKAIEAIRNELGVIGRTINEAMPRQAIESIEQQIQELSRRLTDSRDNGSDRDALGGIEQALADVRDILRTLTPAENLRGYNDAINELGRKLDLIVAEKDPATLDQLDEAITSLRELSANIASAEAIDSLSTQVRALTEKIDCLALGSGAGDVLGNLQERIEILTRALSERTEAETAVPERLEKLMHSLSDKIEQLQKSDNDNIAASQLEDRIVKLMSRLDASEARLGQLDAIERGLADLLVVIEDLRTNRPATNLRAEIPVSDLSKHEVAQVRNSIEPAQALGVLAAGPSVIIDQADAPSTQTEWPILRPIAPASAIAEKSTANDEVQLPAPPLTLDAALRATVASLTASMPTETQLWPSPASASSLPTDEPLEPGSGPPRAGVSPSNRIAASEAILVGARPTAAGHAGKSNFIAAARRAAQAASHDAGGRTRRSERAIAGINAATAPHGKAATRVKSLFVAASVVAIIVGSAHYIGHVFDFGILESKDNKVAISSTPDTEPSELAVPLADSGNQDEDNEQSKSAGAATPSAEGDVTASFLAPPALPSLAPVPGPAMPQMPSGAMSNQLPPTRLLAPPALGSPPGRAPNDVTGSVARTPAESPTKRQAEPTQQPAIADQLPAGIGGPQLRNAAIAGDAGAAYEIALRYVEARGVPANLEEAARWFERAASKGLAPAQFRYASMLEKGQGVRKDLAAAQRLYIAAAAKGHAKAMHNLAVLYAEGIDGKPDYANAAQWFRKAAELGVADSQYNLGVLAARGLGTERNIAESYKWFALAAAQGDREATRKRDEVAGHLDAPTLASAQQAVKDFTPMTQPAAAIAVPAPPGGWDRTTQKPRAAAPLSISAFNSGKL